MDGLVIFQARIRIGDNAGASLKVRLSIFQYSAAQRDAGIDIAVESEITDRARIAATSGSFQLADDLHGADFRRARNGASGKSRFNQVKRIATFAQTASHV